MPLQLLIRIAPFLFSFLVGGFAAYKATADHYKAIIADKDLKAAQAVAVAHERVIEAQKTQQEITKKVTSDYETKRQEIEAKYSSLVFSPSIGLRDGSGSGTRGLSPVPKTASRPNGASECNRLSADLRKAAEQNTLQLIYLQDWVAEQENAAK